MTAPGQAGATRRLVIVVALLIVLGVLAAGPFRTGKQLRAAREAAAARDAATTAKLDALAAQSAELIELVDEQRAALDRGAPPVELDAIAERISIALAALRDTARGTPQATPAPAPPPPPPAATPAPARATTPRPPPRATPGPTPCGIRLPAVCVLPGGRL